MTEHKWRHGQVPLMVIGSRIEHWNKADKDSWFRMIGTLSVVDGDVGMLPDDVETMDFHDHPPCPTEADQVWRLT